MTDSWLDGNAIAGLLVEALGTEMTEAPRRCQSCGAVNVVGAHRVYQGAGVVLRCPACGDVALRVVTLAEQHVLTFAGEWRVETPR
jgi:predicted RNA-binding Zn-ribbon protein involved in translation (DUF1610 family)